MADNLLVLNYILTIFSKNILDRLRSRSTTVDLTTNTPFVFICVAPDYLAILRKSGPGFIPHRIFMANKHVKFSMGIPWDSTDTLSDSV